MIELYSPRALEMPAMNNEVVTQEHADYCAKNGHAKQTVDGVVSEFCPRCGDKR